MSQPTFATHYMVRRPQPNGRASTPVRHVHESAMRPTPPRRRDAATSRIDPAATRTGDQLRTRSSMSVLRFG